VVSPTRHRFHALCPYFAMFPETFAEYWIGRLSKPGDLIFDPFCGRGTAPFQALLMGRRAIGNDINPVAYCITRAKTRAPARPAVLGRITRLEQAYVSTSHVPHNLPPFFKYAYHKDTLDQILFLRSRLNWRHSDTDGMVAALALGALHGEMDRSQAYLSNQMPRTISTKPAYSIRFWQERKLRAPRRDVFAVLRRAAVYRYESTPPVVKGDVILGDMRDLPSRLRGAPIRLAITSPPYFDTTSFEEDQWLRLWFLGEPPVPSLGRLSPDDRHYSRDAYWRLIADMWRMLGAVLAPKSHVVLRLGYRESPTEEVIDMLKMTGTLARRPLRLRKFEESPMRRRQTDAFRPGSVGYSREIDAHFVMA
jgi:DNA methylase